MNDPTIDFQIGISYETGVPEEIIINFESEIAATGLEVKSESRYVDQYVGIEWLAPK